MKQKELTNPVMLSIMVSEDDAEYLRLLAFKKRVSKSKLIREAINEYIVNQKKVPLKEGEF